MTGLTLKTNRSEYSRLEPARSSIQVRMLPAPATGLDVTVLLALRKKGGPVIDTVETKLTGDLPKGQIARFDTTAIKDADGIPLCTRGDYQIEAYSPAADYAAGNPPMAVSAAIRIALITVEEMRKGYCFGTPLYASDTPGPKRQPVVVTGVRITRLSEDTRKGVAPLAYTAGDNTLSWNGGPPVPIGSDREILPDGFGGYAEVEIDEFNLPAGDASEGIVVDKEDMADDFIRAEIDKAIDSIESSTLKVYVEPTRIATEPYYSNPEPGEWYDKLAVPVMFTRRDFNRNGMTWHLDIPVAQLLKIDKIAGYMGNTKALTIQQGAFSVNRKAGMLDVLPYNSQYSYLFTFFQQLQFWGAREFIAGFWRYTGVAGLTETPGDVLKLIGYTAATTILTVAGQAYKGGFSSESVSKDGVSRSASYTASATYGIYSATITEYKDWIKTNARRIRDQYRGIQMMVL